MQKSPSKKKDNRDSDTTSRFVTFQGEQIGMIKMSSLGADDISSKNVTFYGAEQQSKQFHVRSGAVNLKLKQGMHIPTTDFDELNKLIESDGDQGRFDSRQIAKLGLATQYNNPSKKNFQIYQNNPKE
jgi:hypothetical protein